MILLNVICESPLPKALGSDHALGLVVMGPSGDKKLRGPGETVAPGVVLVCWDPSLNP